METITFSDKNSYRDFGLLLKSREIGEAEPRTNYIDVPARDGLLDITEAFGEVKYKNRPLTFVFEYVGSNKDWLPTLSALNNYINGQKHNIYFEADYYWVGRCFVKAAQSKRGIREITIECDCEPYKYKLEDTIIETQRKNLFNCVDSPTTEYITNNNDGTFTINSTYYYGKIYANKDVLEIGKTYTFSQYVESAQDSENSNMQFSVVVYYEDNESVESRVQIQGANKRYMVQVTPTKEIKNIEIRPLKKGNETTLMTGIIKDIQIEKGTTATYYSPYDTDIKTIVNDRKTVTPKVTVIAGEPILSWTDKKTGARFSQALPSTFDNKILDFKLYEGNNTFEVKGGDIRLTYREASL